MKPLLVSSGEPAGIGPDLCLALAGHDTPLVVLGDQQILEQRARQLNWPIEFDEYHPDTLPVPRPHHLTVLSMPCAAPVFAGKLNSRNAAYVLAMLSRAASGCLNGEFAALITAPVHKAIINQAGFDFTGHTEFFAQHCKTETVVMMLVCKAMRVALVTTHLPLRAVADAITQTLLVDVITILDKGLRDDFEIACPKIHVAGLNPHAGEAGFLGREELDTIIPALSLLKNKGLHLSGPFPADTMFTPHQAEKCDAFVAMYHDQGLPVLKYAGFGTAVNVTLGLPMIRTSVDHGTALELAGTGRAESGSLVAAVDLAARMVKARS